jgi:hypothetical protein
MLTVLVYSEFCWENEADGHSRAHWLVVVVVVVVVEGVEESFDVDLRGVAVPFLEAKVNAWNFLIVGLDAAVGFCLVASGVEAEVEDLRCSIELGLIDSAALSSIPHNEHA